MSNSTRVTIDIDSELFQKLQSLAVPLVDNTDSVINKLLDHWEQNHKAEEKTDLSTEEEWMTPRGEKLLVGTRLRAYYNGKEFTAEVTRSGIFVQGETFNSPSAAAIHAKNLANVTGASASTNGWKFWEYWDEAEQMWRGIRIFQQLSKIKWSNGNTLKKSIDRIKIISMLIRTQKIISVVGKKARGRTRAFRTLTGQVKPGTQLKSLL